MQLTGSSRSGLSAVAAAQRLAHDGPNELHEVRSIRPLHIALRQFQSLIIWVLIVAGGIAGALGEFVDAFVIIIIVLLNAIIGFVQEYKAEHSIAALRKMTAPQARVRRDGRSLLVPASQLVVGDMLEIEAGNLVTAGLPALCLAADSLDPGLMQSLPRARTDEIISRAVLPQFILATFAHAALGFGVFVWTLHDGGLEVACSTTFTAMVLSLLFKSLGFRSLKTPPWWLAQPQLLLIVGASVGLQLMLHHVPFLSHLLHTVMPSREMQWLLPAIGCVPLLVLELAKRWTSPLSQHQPLHHHANPLCH